MSTRRERSLVAASLAILVLATTARAEAPAAITLQEAIDIALKNHPQLRAAEAEARVAKEQVAEAKAAYLPQIAVSLTGSAANQPSRIGAGSLPASSLFNRFGQGISLAQLVTDSGRTTSLIKSSRLQAGAAEQGYQATRAEVLLAVTRAYFEVLRSQGLVRVADKTVATRQLLFERVQALANNKLRSLLDVSFAQVSFSDAQLMKIRAEDEREAAYAEFDRTLGGEQATRYELTEEPMPPAPPPSADDLIESAVANRPDLASLRLSSEAAHAFFRAERDLSYPTVSLVGVAGLLPYLEQNPGTKTPDHYEAAAINVQIPVFSGHLFGARREAARYQAEATDQRARELKHRVVRDVRVAFGALATAFQRLDVTAQLLKQATLGLDLADGRYNLGLSSIVELTQAQLNLTQAEVENLGATYDYEDQYALLQYTIGSLH